MYFMKRCELFPILTVYSDYEAFMMRSEVIKRMN